MGTVVSEKTYLLRSTEKSSEVILNICKRKMILGKDPLCDLVLPAHEVSTIHAFMCLTPKGILVKDLCSSHGTFVNGKKISEALIIPGDTISFGNIALLVEISDAVEIGSDEEIPGLPYEIIGEIDPEVLFDDSNFIPLDKIPSHDFTGDYEELEETSRPLEIEKRIRKPRLEVITYISGFIQDVRYLKVQKGDFFLSPSTQGSRKILFSSLQETKIFTITKQGISFTAIEELTPSVPWNEVDLSKPFFVTKGTEQLSFRLIEDSLGLSGIPFFYRDREFYKKTLMVFVVLFLPFLLINLIDPMQKAQDPKPEVAVIYKLPKPEVSQDKTSDLSSEEVTSTDENTGNKSDDQPSEKVEFAEAAKAQAPEKVVEVSKKKSAPKPTAVTKTKPVPTPAPSIEAVPIPKAALVAAAPTPKPYAFKSRAMGSLVSDIPSINTPTTVTGEKSKAVSFNAVTSESGNLMNGEKMGVSKLNGNDSRGKGLASYGSKGLASKAGFDSAYLQPNTVVVGSMDPELLRKILREYIPQFRHCYQKELVHVSEDLRGIMDLNFTIGPMGKATKFQVSMKDARFSKAGVDCVGSVLRHIEFPKPKGGGVVDVRQPLNFLSEKRKI